MPLTPGFAAAHIRHWQNELNRPAYNHRRYWPACLFHHAPIENAAAILATGMLRSRNQLGNLQPRDVAACNVNAARDHAHDRVRVEIEAISPMTPHVIGADLVLTA